jgi:hypothetical protein
MFIAEVCSYDGLVHGTECALMRGRCTASQGHIELCPVFDRREECYVSSSDIVTCR